MGGSGCTIFPNPYPPCTGAYTGATLGNEGLQLSGSPNYGTANGSLLKYGLLPVDGSPAPQALDVYIDCLGQADPCAQEFPIRAAFYEPRFPELWAGSGSSASVYQPAVGYYSVDETTAQEQIRAMQYAGIQAGISRWAGEADLTDGRLVALLNAAKNRGSGFKWAVQYAREELSNPTEAQITTDLSSLNSVRPGLTGGGSPMGHASYLQALGKRVIFVMADAAELANVGGDGGLGCQMLRRWDRTGALRDYYVVMRDFANRAQCQGLTTQPDSWYRDSFSISEDPLDRPSASPPPVPYSYSISPGYHKRAEAGARLSRDFLRWTKAIQDMVASKADWQLVPFNQWVEGAAVEGSPVWQSTSIDGFYLDTLHTDGQQVHDIVVAAGDIACEQVEPPGPPPLIPHCHQRQTSDLFITPSGQPFSGLTNVLTLGDNQYHCGQLSQFQAQFGPTWGRVLQKIRPSIGNHEYNTESVPGGPPDSTCGGTAASGYFNYFAGTGTPIGSSGQARYNFTIGADWNLIALDSQCRKNVSPALSVCDGGDPTRQETDLANHLATISTEKCILAYWHHPRFSSRDYMLRGVTRDRDVLELWTALWARRADVVLNGHDHLYERSALQNDQAGATSEGIRQFIVGTGGKSIKQLEKNFTSNPLPNSEALDDGTYMPVGAQPGDPPVPRDGAYGVLQMVLYDRADPTNPAARGRYVWQFVPETVPSNPGTLFQDGGSQPCH